MFDANMRHLPKGKYFFAKVYNCGKQSKLYRYGVRNGDIVKCKMRDVRSECPRVKIFTPKGRITIKPEWDYSGELDYWLVYEGNIDGSGFICEESRKWAMQL